ncbi:MAG TPA: NUDIX hydrolase [Spirochaetia bacterium]|nr:NUDIX hydrolase [Spirochaetia bacterium]
MPDRDAHLRWKELSRRSLAASGLFDLVEAQRVSSNGRRGDFWILEARDWVNVVPVIRDPDGTRRFLMVRQYRHGADLITTEFPAGLIERGEDPSAAAARELEEETGHRAGRLSLIGELRPNPAFMTNRCFTFLAEDLVRASALSLDELEVLEPLTLTADEVDRQMGRGELVNAMTVAALFAYHRHLAADR